jgi:hypothetical protein
VIGDDAKSEQHTFVAVRDAINHLAALIGYVVNNLNGHTVFVTADHGFLFTESAPTEISKSDLPFKPEDAAVAKKRYLIGKNLPDSQVAWHGKTAITAGAQGGMEFWVPRGVSLFHLTGGARFVHGGAMLQEVVVPIISVKHVRGKAAEQTLTKPVTVHVLGTKHKVTTNRHRFELIQMEPVSDRVKPITLKIGVFDGPEPVTNVETVTFDSTSPNMEERRKWVTLTLTERQYDKKKPYRLVLRDADTGIEQQSVDVTIDKAFTDDF